MLGKRCSQAAPSTQVQGRRICSVREIGSGSPWDGSYLQLKRTCSILGALQYSCTNSAGLSKARRGQTGSSSQAAPCSLGAGREQLFASEHINKQHSSKSGQPISSEGWLMFSSMFSPLLPPQPGAQSPLLGCEHPPETQRRAGVQGGQEQPLMHTQPTDFNRFAQRHGFNELFPWKTFATRL